MTAQRLAWRGAESIRAAFTAVARMAGGSSRAAESILLESRQCHACGSLAPTASQSGARCPRCGERTLRICLVGA